jgi:hypothetical protein
VSTTCAKHFHPRKHGKLFIKIYKFIFCIYGCLPNYLCIITYACENHHHHANYHNMNYQIFLLKCIPCRFYIWKVAKTKSLSHVLKKEYPNYEYAHEQVQHSSKLTLMIKPKKFTQVWNPNVRGVVSWFFR